MVLQSLSCLISEAAMQTCSASWSFLVACGTCPCMWAHHASLMVLSVLPPHSKWFLHAIFSSAFRFVMNRPSLRLLYFVTTPTYIPLVGICACFMDFFAPVILVFYIMPGIGGVIGVPSLRFLLCFEVSRDLGSHGDNNFVTPLSLDLREI